MANEIEVKGIKYSIGKISAMKQFHVSRRIAPILPKIIPVFSRLKESGKPISDDLDGLAEAIEPFTHAIADMKDDDAEYVINACMSVIQRQHGDRWTAVWNSDAMRAMFDDVDMSVILPLVVQTIIINLGPFMQGLLTSQLGSPQ